MEKLALLSVSDKTGLLPFAEALVKQHGYKLLSTGGTAKMLQEAGLPVTEVSEHTKFPEMMEGRVKTLHPMIHGGLLCRRDKEDHLEQAAAHGIDLIDLVVVNLYPFTQTIERPDCTWELAIENIDIGGPSMLRSAAKNHQSVTVVCDPEDYSRVLEAMGDEKELLCLRRGLAQKVYETTGKYDQAISEYFLSQKDEPNLDDIAGLPASLKIDSPKAMTMRYGENPHQKAALYGDFLNHYEQLQGKELSFNNIIDISAATYLIGEFERPTMAILKHTNPCGVASGDDLVEAWTKALATDKQSPFGGIIVANRTIDEEVANLIKDLFCEVIIAPVFTEEARAIFAKKKNLRLMVSKESLREQSLLDMRSVVGGFLLQDRDQTPVRPQNFKVVTERQPTEEEMRALIFAWRVVRHVKSNAIVYGGPERTLGVGAGQMSRVDSSKIAVWKAGEADLSLENSVIASDAFFPFPDGLLAAAEAGATAAIQPGGSMRDEEVIAAANEKGMAMVFTGMRHFRH